MGIGKGMGTSTCTSLTVLRQGCACAGRGGMRPTKKGLPSSPWLCTPDHNAGAAKGNLDVAPLNGHNSTFGGGEAHEGWLDTV